ncbi:MAG: DNA-3-methyladenine glycosylase [Verrucomicrobiales bacterium]|nr:DNA-3-methyladenine glycosylase [Verrucomicrobiales bacterium]
MTRPGRSFFERDPQICARELIGCLFQWGDSAGLIVETEAYAEHGDEACHTFFRPSARDFVSRNPAGTAYVYLNYGMYWLTNVLCINPQTGNNGFVLLRALEPVQGISIMQKRRNKTKLTDLCSGPGKLSMALGIGKTDHGTDIADCFHPGKELPVAADRRIGISRAQELEWRFLEAGNPHLSVPFGKAK